MMETMIPLYEVIKVLDECEREMVNRRFFDRKDRYEWYDENGIFKERDWYYMLITKGIRDSRERIIEHFYQKSEEEL